MSFFFNNNCNNQKPSCINPQTLNNICEKILIEVPRVFDACICRDDSESFLLTLANFTPTPTFPITYVSTVSLTGVKPTVTSTQIDRTDCSGNFARVTVSFNIPLVVSWIDANGVSGTATSSATITKTAVLCVPENSLTPIEIDITAFFSSTIGTFPTETTAQITACVQTIIKIIGVVDVLVPTFGYPCIPFCQGTSPANCEAVFNQPLYPTR